jgi:xeroderma pigmentosum group C-complementing protein
MIHKSRVPDQNKRGRLFETAIAHLVQWWSGAYFEVDFAGHIRNKTFDEVQSQIAGLSLEAILDLLEEQDSEVIRSPNSLMKHTLMRSGSRDTSAQLFTALCRALGIPARLVVSLQSVPWQASVGKSKSTPKASGKRNRGVSTGKGKGREQVLDDVEADDRSGSAMEESRIPSSSGQGDVKGKAKEGSFPGEGQNLRGTLNVKIDGNEGKEKAKPVIKLRKTKNKGQKLGASSPSRTQGTWVLH